MNSENPKGNLLIIDDEQLLTESIELLMKRHADQIYCCHSGKEALETLKSKNIHCVICDINMPNMNGVEVIKKARSLGYDRPFIFYTAYGNQDLMMEAIKYEAFDFLDKPNLDGLVEVVQQGLKSGVSGKSLESEPQSFMSEFQSLVNKIEKK